jgi:hypothetical protein
LAGDVVVSMAVGLDNELVVNWACTWVDDWVKWSDDELVVERAY